MILHGRTSRELSWLSRGALVLIGLILLPLSATLTAGAEEAETSQLEPAHPAESATVAEPVQVTPAAPAALPGGTATTEPAGALAAPIGVTTAPAAESPALPSRVTSAAAPATAAPSAAPSTTPGFTPPSAGNPYDPSAAPAGAIAPAAPSAFAVPPGNPLSSKPSRMGGVNSGPAISQRLQKLEMVTEQIMHELRALRGVHTPPHGAVTPSQQPSVYNTLGHQPNVNNDMAVKGRFLDKHAFEAQTKNLQLELQVLEQQLRLQELEIAKKRAELEWHEKNFKRNTFEVSPSKPTEPKESPTSQTR